LRSILGDLFHRSPFEALHQHLEKVRECCNQLPLLMKAFGEQDSMELSRRVQKISHLEHEADIIKNGIRERLPYRMFMSVNRSDILTFLKQEDAIADSVEDIARLIEMRKTLLPSGLKDELMKLVDKVLETVDALIAACSRIKILSQSSFSQFEEEKVSELIGVIDRSEFEADVIQQNCAKKMFEMEKKIDAISIFFLMKIIGELGSVADHAQGTGDHLRCMIAR